MRVAAAFVGLFFSLSGFAGTPTEGSESSSEEPASEEGASEEERSTGSPAEVRPAEVRPAEVRPAEARPAETRPQPVDLPPRGAPTVPEPLPQISGKDALAVTGEVRGVLLGARLDTLDARVQDQSPSLSLQLPFVALKTQASLGENVEAVLALRLDDAAVVPAWNQQGLWDTHIAAKFGVGGLVTVGLLPAALGFDSSVVDQLGGIGGVDQWVPLAWASEISPARVLGLSVEHPLGPRGQVHLQAAQNPDWLGGESGTARVEFHAGRRGGLQVDSSLGARVTVERGASFNDGSVDLAAGLVAEKGSLLLAGELLVGLEENGPIAWEIAGGLALPWQRQSLLPDDLLLRLRDTNPTAVTEEDRLWQVASGLTWSVVDLEKTLLSVGVIWEVELPENVAAAIEHEASVGLHSRF